jgi:endonuclease YncB( thermonuclease family)
MLSFLNRMGFGILNLLLLTSLSLSPAHASISITSIYDGDTFTLNTGERVRLLQIDTPELSSKECYGNEARALLIKLTTSKRPLKLKKDPKLDEVDRYGRILRYVFIGKKNINLVLVKKGAAAPYFYRGEKGMYSSKLLAAATKAKAKNIGLWKSCPGTILSSNLAVSTDTNLTAPAYSNTAPGESCDPNYAGCVPLYPPDLNCSEIRSLGLAPVTVLGEDVHNLDADGNGVGCE